MFSSVNKFKRKVAPWLMVLIFVFVTSPMICVSALESDSSDELVQIAEITTEKTEYTDVFFNDNGSKAAYQCLEPIVFENGDGGYDDFVLGEVLAPADSMEHAQEIASAYKLELKSYAYGIAVLTALNPEQTVYQSQMAIRSVGIPELSLNLRYTIYNDLDTTTADMYINGRVGKITTESHVPGADPSFVLNSSAQWHHAIMETESAHQVTMGEGVVIAVIDTGIDISHSDFAGRISQKSYNSYTDHVGFEYVQDDEGHGTHVIGIAAGAINNTTNVYGVAPSAEILAIKANTPSDPRSFNTATVLRGINYAAENGADIINMSLGRSYNYGADTLERSTIAKAVANGVTIIAAAGNDSNSHAGYPAAYPEVIAVSAIKQDGAFDSSYSDFGPEIDVAAPGTSIYAANNGGGYVEKTGTSMAAPNAAGVAALIKASNLACNQKQIRSVLEETATGIAYNEYCGYGVVNAYAAALAIFGDDELLSVTFEFNDGVRSPIIRYYLPGGKQMEPAWAWPTRDGYAFTGWYTSTIGGEKAAFPLEVIKDLTLYAQWEEQAYAPTANPDPGAVLRGTQIALSTATSGATICYTTDGSEPTESSMVYSSPITITSETIIKAKAFINGKLPSETATFNYTIALAAAPNANPAPGAVIIGTHVTLFSVTQGATIRYTTDGSEPTESSVVYTSPITITAAILIKAKAFANNMVPSDTIMFNYTIGFASAGFIAPIAAPDPEATKIYTAQDLWNVRNNLTGSFVLMNDIDLSTINGGEWTPIGDDSTGSIGNRFSGVFDGQGFKIHNLTIRSVNSGYVGLFGFVSGGTVKNVGIGSGNIDISSETWFYAGGICGLSYAIIDNCYNMANISGSAPGWTTRVGGICGSSYTETPTPASITRSYNTGNIFSSFYAGGITGDTPNPSLAGTPISINSCYNTGNVTTTTNDSYAYAGGISPCIIIGSISNCYNSGEVYAYTDLSMAVAGGITGSLDFSTIANCCNTGNVTADSPAYFANAGGISGIMVDSSASITNCYNKGDVLSTATYAHTGGMCSIFSNSPGTVSNSVVLSGRINADKINGSSSNLIGPRQGGSGALKINNYALTGISGNAVDDSNRRISLNEAKSGSTYEVDLGWDFNSVWSIDENFNNGLPYLQIFRKPQVTAPDINITDVLLGKEARFSCPTEGATIYATIDGTDPDRSSQDATGLYLNMYWPETLTIKAIAVKDGFEDSAVSAITLAIIQAQNPTADPSPGVIPIGMAIALTAYDFTEIHYTTDGAEPSLSSPKYTTPIVLNSTTTIKVKNYRIGMAASDTATFSYTVETESIEPDFTIIASHVKEKAGKTVTVPITLENNPGIMNLRLKIMYNVDILKLESVTSEWGEMTFIPSGDISDNPYNALWISDTLQNNNKDSLILNLEFTILSDASDGVYQIELIYDPLNTVDENNNQIEARLVNGSVEVISYLYGDADDNGVITSYDAVLILRYVNGWDMSSYSFNPLAADVDGNGVITSYDAVLILRYVNDWFDIFPVEMADVSLSGASVASSSMFIAMNALNDTPVVSAISPSDPVKPGDTVIISLKLEDNPGIMSLRAGIAYDNEALQLKSATSAWADMTYTPAQYITNDPYYAMWTSSTLLNNNDDGVILNLQFKVLPDAADGIYPIKLMYDQFNTFDEYNNPISVSLVNGSITIERDIVLPYYTITARSGTGGAAIGGGESIAGDTVTLTASANNNYEFEGWYENNIKINDASAIYSFIAESDRTLEARFTPVQLSDDAYSLTGKIRTYNPGYSATVKLIQGDKEIDRIDIPVELGSGQRNQNFEFKEVASGTYSLVITKDGHTKFTVQSIIIEDKNVDLTEDSRPEVRLMTLQCGDINGDGVIDDRDLTILWLSTNYFKNTLQATNPLCDLNGDGVVDDRDLTILWMAYNYYRGEFVI